MSLIQNYTQEIEEPSCESRKQRRQARRVPSHFGF